MPQSNVSEYLLQPLWTNYCSNFTHRWVPCLANYIWTLLSIMKHVHGKPRSDPSSMGYLSMSQFDTSIWLTIRIVIGQMVTHALQESQHIVCFPKPCSHRLLPEKTILPFRFLTIMYLNKAIQPCLTMCDHRLVTMLQLQRRYRPQIVHSSLWTTNWMQCLAWTKRICH